MAYHPISRPEPFDPLRPSAVPVSLAGSQGNELEDGLSLAELATALSAHGGGALSADLALDLVLNEIVEHARLATGATAAAIALARGDEIVCRATTGENAPDLGVRLDVDAGLSGACVQSKKWQRCDDTETDSRVDAEVCRDLGVRSILVFPVVRENILLGVFEIFSPRPNAFSDREIQTLEALSRRIVNNVDRAADVLAPSTPVFTPSAIEPAATATVPELASVDSLPSDADVEGIVDPAQVDLNQLEPAEPDAPPPVAELLPEADVATNSAIRPRDHWMSVLTLAVIALALFVGWMMGYVKRQRAPVATQAKTVMNAPVQPAPAKPAEGSASSAAAPAPDPSAASKSALTASQPGGSPPTASQSAEAGSVPTGGLVVYENGKVIFRTPPPTAPHTAKDSNSGPVQVPSKVADEYLVLRVEPEYPESAREQRIQGPVVLQVLVGKDGTVEKLSTISGDPQLATAATDAVTQWRFKPFFRNGSPQEFQTQVTVSFRLP